MITIVGVGALGSHVVQWLRNESVAMRAIDFDRVEQKNVRSQFHATPSVGKTKVASLQQTMTFLFGHKILGVPHKLTTDNQAQLLAESSLVIDCLDNGEGRRLVQEQVRRTRTPCLHGGLAGGGSFGRVMWDESFVIDDEPSEGAATCQDGDQLPFIALVSSVMALAAQRFLRDQGRQSYLVYPTGSVVVA